MEICVGQNRVSTNRSALRSALSYKKKCPFGSTIKQVLYSIIGCRMTMKEKLFFFIFHFDCVLFIIGEVGKTTSAMNEMPSGNEQNTTF